MSIADFIEDFFELDPENPIKLHEYQRNFLESDSKFRLVLKARQVGITSVVAWEALAYALIEPHMTILFVSASHRQAMEILNYVKRIMSNLRLKKEVRTLEETKQSVVYENGARIISLPNNPNTIQGIRAHRVYIDEFAIMENDKEILSAILPSISHGGSITIFSRPWGKRGEFYRLVKESREKKNQFVLFEIDWTQCKHPSYQQMVGEFKEFMPPLQFAELYSCEFVDETKSYFPYEIMFPCIDEDMTRPRPGMKLILGVDFGRFQNSTVITITEERGDCFYVRQIKEFLGVRYTTQLNYLGKLIEELDPKEVRVDSFGVGIRLYEELREKHGSKIVPVSFSNQNKNEMITNLRILFEDKKIRIPRDDKLISQLHALERKKGAGYVRWEPGKTDDYGRHDDFVWSLTMSVVKKYREPIRYFKLGEDESRLRGFNKEFKHTVISDEDEKSSNVYI